MHPLPLRRPQTPSDPWQSLIRLLRYRPRSISEVRRRLTAQGFDRETIEETINKAEAAGLLDDRLFARLWVEDRLLHHPLSRRAIAQELAEKGIAPEIASVVLEEHYPPEKEEEIALDLAQTRLARYQGLEPARRVRRTVSFLTRRGFNAALASRVVRALSERLSDREIGESDD